MGITYNPRIVTDGLTNYFDASNPKSYDGNENLLTYSEDFTNAFWAGSQANVTFTANSTTAPDGTNTADLVSNTGQTISLIGALVTVPASSINDYYVTVYAKKSTASSFTFNCWYSGNAEDNVDFNFDTGVVSNVPYSGEYIFQSVGNGWYRCGFRITKDTQSRTQIVFRMWESGRGLTSGNTYFWGAQLEKGKTANPYYATTASTKTRGTTWYNLIPGGVNGTLTNQPTYSSANGGVIVLDGIDDYISIPINLSTSTYTIMGAARYVVVGGRTFSALSNNWLMGHWSSSTENYYAEGWVSGVQAGASDTNWRIYAATGNYSADSWGFYVNGQLKVSPNNSGSAGPNGLSIGASGGFSEFSNSHISNLIIYNRVLSATEIQQNFNALRSRFSI
jgi:hypothetical protein